MSRAAKVRDYPPLILASLVMLALLALMPSALNLPQSNPGETLEYAPVPPEDENPPPPATGNFASLGLGTSASVGATGSPADAGPVGEAGGRPIKTAGTKRCVGNPPRQTEDPLSPPCVGFYQGDNGGSTATGVTRDEIVVVVYFDEQEGNNRVSSKGAETCNHCRDSFVDLLAPPQEDEYVFERLYRDYQRFFNERFQTYDRLVHFWIQYSSDDSPEARRADAARTISERSPFAVISYAEENADAYTSVVARRGTVVFTGFGTASAVGERAESFRKFPGQLWSYVPSLEQQAASFSDIVCRQVVPHPVSFGGNGDAGQPRKLGYLRANDEDRPDLITLAKLVRSQIEACGGRFVAESTFAVPDCGTATCQTNEDPLEPPAQTFANAGVTTVIWPGGLNVQQSFEAAAIDYRPEWVVLGDGRSDTTFNNQQHEQSVWEHARVLTRYTHSPRFEDRPCVTSAREANPQAPYYDLRLYGCEYYPTLLQLFTGIQVAGPRLDVPNLDKGFHAIPAVRSEDVRVPACFYDPGDYTCVKDAMVGWWDADGVNDNGTSGCWRVMEGGKRYLRGDWARADIDSRRAQSNPCSNIGRNLTG